MRLSTYPEIVRPIARFFGGAVILVTGFGIAAVWLLVAAFVAGGVLGILVFGWRALFGG